MPTKTFNLSIEALSYLTTLKYKNASIALDHLIIEHRGLSPEIRRMEALTKLREAAATLQQDHKVEQEAILFFVKEAIGGEQG